MLTQTIRQVVPGYGYTTPTREEITAELEATKFTPDVMTLELYEWQLFFAVDTLKKDHPQHKMLGDSIKYKHPAYTQADMQFFDNNVPFQPPIPMKAGDSAIVKGWPPAAKIKGEVYAIRPQQFWKTLDKEYQNTVQFQRHRVRLIVPYRMVAWLKDVNAIDLSEFNPLEAHNSSRTKHTRERVAIIRAWMYLGKPEYWDNLLNPYEYSSVEVFKANNRTWLDKYYHIRRPNLPPVNG